MPTAFDFVRLPIPHLVPDCGMTGVLPLQCGPVGDHDPPPLNGSSGWPGASVTIVVSGCAKPRGLAELLGRSPVPQQEGR
jgi:hypothetical protein